MDKVIVVIDAGSIGQAIARGVSSGKKVLLADLRQDNAEMTIRNGQATRSNSQHPVSDLWQDSGQRTSNN